LALKCESLEIVYHPTATDFQIPSRVNSLNYSSDGLHVLSSSDDGTLLIYSALESQETRRLYCRRHGAAHALFAHHPSAVLLASANNKFESTFQYLCPCLLTLQTLFDSFLYIPIRTCKSIEATARGTSTVIQLYAHVQSDWSQSQSRQRHLPFLFYRFDSSPLGFEVKCLPGTHPLVALRVRIHSLICPEYFVVYTLRRSSLSTLSPFL